MIHDAVILWTADGRYLLADSGHTKSKLQQLMSARIRNCEEI